MNSLSLAQAAAMLGISCFLLGVLCTYVAGKFYQHFVSEDEEMIIEEPDYIVS